MRKNRGVTLIELTIVMAVIAILAVVATPKFADLIRKANEAATKGNLGSARSAISIYYGETEGVFPLPTVSGAESTPGTLGAILTVNSGKYINKMPACFAPPYHSRIDWVEITIATSNEAVNPGAWGYKTTSDGIGNPQGSLWVNCTHTDTRGINWGFY